MRRVASTLMGFALLGSALAPAAGAASTVQATCSDFGSKLTAAGAGDTIVLTGLCGSPNNAFTLPATANLTIEGAASGTNGFDGTGVGTPALASPGGGTDGISVRDLTFENYPASSAVKILSPSPATNVTNQYGFSGDHFLNNTSPGNGGGLDLEAFTDSTTGSCTAPAPIISLTGSTFSGNSSTFIGGGAFLDLECKAGSPTVTVASDTFTGNSAGAGAGTARGGGLSVSPAGFHLFTPNSVLKISLTQSDNVFSGNSLSGAFTLSGAGEETAGANVTSTSDTFVNNSMPGMPAANRPHWGAGLSTLGSDCTTTGGPVSTFNNLVAAGNTIGAPSGTGTGGQGAGVYAGCGPPGSGGYNLTLVNPTISGNTATGSGAVAGLAGEASDILGLKNGIVFGNQSAPDFGGFGGGVTVASSDFCAAGTSDPFAGAGNICTDPLLVNPGGGDVHETAASPTIDVGDNSLVTASTDVFGNPRILVGKTGDPAVVDMGAAEFGPAPPAPSTTPLDNSFKVGKVKGKTLFVTVHAPGTVKVVQASGSGRGAAASAKKKLLKPSKGSGGPGTIKVKLKLTKKANKTLKKKGKLKVKSQVTFTPTGGTAKSQRATLKLKKPKS